MSGGARGAEMAGQDADGGLLAGSHVGRGERAAGDRAGHEPLEGSCSKRAVVLGREEGGDGFRIER